MSERFTVIPHLLKIRAAPQTEGTLHRKDEG
jgi:hypothetical protein